MNAGSESEVVAVFSEWLRQHGWQVQAEVDWADVVAERGNERLVAEAKGLTTSRGLDIDTLYGQLLRRMTDGGGTRYAVVVPEESIPAACRVAPHIRERLSIDLYGICRDDAVRKH